MKHTPYDSRVYPAGGGTQDRYRFPNGYGASVVRTSHSYGGDEGLFELGVIGRDGHLDYSTPITDDVLGYLTGEAVQGVLDQIAALPVEKA